MAALDYGAIIRVDRKYIYTGNFPEIEEVIPGKTDTIVKDPYNIIGQRRSKDEEGNYHVDSYNYLGTKDFYVALNRYIFFVVKNDEVIGVVDFEETYLDTLGIRHSMKATVDGVEFTVKRFSEDNNRYYVRFIYDDIVYEGIYGYGVDAKIHRWYDLTPKDSRKLKAFMNRD